MARKLGAKPRPPRKVAVAPASRPVVRRIAQGLVRCDGLVWTAGKARKPGTCWLDGQPFARGAIVFKPVTNDHRRMRRMAAFSVDLEIARQTRLQL